jgi:hypothetical protein
MVDEQEARRCLVEMMMKPKGSRFRRNGQNGERDVASPEGAQTAATMRSSRSVNTAKWLS